MEYQCVVISFFTFDQERWPGAKCSQGGYLQSPINIDEENVINDYVSSFIKYGDLQFTGYNRVLMTGLNNGHTVQFSTEGSKEMHPTLTGGPLRFVYRLEQLHFHWLSEHAVDGSKFPMEMHFVHVRSDLRVKDALVMGEGLAIIAVFIQIAKDSQVETTYQNPLQEIVNYMPRLATKGERMSGILLDLHQLLTVDPKQYYAYMGSLTSPECNEVVTWIIMDKPLYVSEYQYIQLTSVGGGRQNARSLQPIRLHKIYRPRDPRHVVPTPDIVNMFRNTYDYFGDVLGNISEAFRILNKLS